MRRALALADAKLGRTAPNPAVGCVIVAAGGGAVIGEAATGEGGRPHAEELALALAEGETAGAEVYVTLEPCAERSSGAPSCTERLLAARPARVIIAAQDPHPKAAGRGLARLREAGVRVETGFCAAEAEALNAGFFSVVRRGRPWVAADDDPRRYDDAYRAAVDADHAGNLRALADAGVTRVHVPPNGALAQKLAALGLLDA